MSLDENQITYFQDHIGVPCKEFSIRGLWNRNRKKVFNAPYFKSSKHCQGEYDSNFLEEKVKLNF